MSMILRKVPILAEDLSLCATLTNHDIVPRRHQGSERIHVAATTQQDTGRGANFTIA